MTTIHFKDSAYSAEKLMTISNTSPIVEFDLNDINDVNDPRYRSFIIGPKAEDVNAIKVPLVYMYEGKPTIIAGKNAMVAIIKSQSTKFKARLISSPVLKRSRIEISRSTR